MRELFRNIELLAIAGFNAKTRGEAADVVDLMVERVKRLKHAALRNSFFMSHDRLEQLYKVTPQEWAEFEKSIGELFEAVKECRMTKGTENHQIGLLKLITRLS